jgi:ATP-dependent DNA ligase
MNPMSLPFPVPLSPMLAKASDHLPDGDGWFFEPKWDGFRCIVERDGDGVNLSSRNGRSLSRYFPEMIVAALAALPAGAVVDGELVVPRLDRPGLDFDALSQRIHPAASRVNRLAAETPSLFVAFDLLALDGQSFLARPFRERRAALADLMPRSDAQTSRVALTPLTDDVAVAARWFSQFEGAGLDGIVAKRADGQYTPGERTMVKVKHERSADCVVAGYRVHKDGKGVGSLLLGLFDDAGVLHHVGVASSFTAKRRAALLEELAALVPTDLGDHPWRDWAVASAHETARLPGGQSRWTGDKDLSFVALRPELVAEVRFSQLQGDRFRHGASLVRWRPDREPSSCTYEQLEVATPVELAELLRA